MPILSAARMQVTLRGADDLALRRCVRDRGAQLGNKVSAQHAA
jgi:hypothetical protein